MNSHIKSIATAALALLVSQISTMFLLEQQLLDEEAKLAHLSNELDKIESALQL